MEAHACRMPYLKIDGFWFVQMRFSLEVESPGAASSSSSICEQWFLELPSEVGIPISS